MYIYSCCGGGLRVLSSLPARHWQGGHLQLSLHPQLVSHLKKEGWGSSWFRTPRQVAVGPPQCQPQLAPWEVQSCSFSVWGGG